MAQVEPRLAEDLEYKVHKCTAAMEQHKQATKPVNAAGDIDFESFITKLKEVSTEYMAHGLLPTLIE